MPDSKQNEMIRTALEGIRKVVDANTVLGQPFKTESGTTIIPVTKVTVGLATGGLDYFGKNAPKGNIDPAKISSFGGGGGTGISVSPVGFLIVKESGSVDLLTVDSVASKSTAVGVIDAVIDAIDRSPEFADKIKMVIAKFKKDKKDGAEKPVEDEEIVIEANT